MEDQALIITPTDYGLLTDLYELTMSACYVGEGLDQTRASFELFTRHLPDGFGYLIAMGLAQALHYLENLQFNSAQIEALQSSGLFDQAPDSFWSVLLESKFSGDVWAVPEGTAVFANEPLLRIEAPLWQAQLAETFVLNAINYQTLIATRAARIRDVAGPDMKLLEFGTRRAFSPQGAMWAARAAIAAGFDSTSNVLAAMKLNRQPSGTMAHALVMAFSAVEGHESDAFDAFYRYFPGAALLIDTYDTITAAERLAERVKREDYPVAAVRLDSGDLAQLSKQVRSLLPETTIFASGDIDEFEIERLNQAHAEIDGYGVGTKLVTGTPVNGVYKLVEIDGIPIMKKASSKESYPGRKQVFRTLHGGQIQGDRLGLADETPLATEQPLLQRVMHQGQRVHDPESLRAIAQRTTASVASLPPDVRRLDQPRSIPLTVSDELQATTTATQRRIEQYIPNPSLSAQ